MKLFYLDNSYTDYVVMAENEEAAWARLRKEGILPPDSSEEDLAAEEGLTAAYYDLVEVTDEYMVDNPNDLVFLL